MRSQSDAEPPKQMSQVVNNTSANSSSISGGDAEAVTSQTDTAKSKLGGAGGLGASRWKAGLAGVTAKSEEAKAKTKLMTAIREAMHPLPSSPTLTPTQPPHRIQGVNAIRTFRASRNPGQLTACS